MGACEKNWGQGSRLESSNSCWCRSKGGGWWLPGDEYKVSSTSSEVAKPFKAIAFCCWERRICHSQAPDENPWFSPPRAREDPLSFCVVTEELRLIGNHHLFLNLFFIGVTLVMTNLDSILKSRDITLATKVHLVKVMVFPVVMDGLRVGL